MHKQADHALGNAKLAGFNKDLKLKGYDYNTVISIFYVSYILFEIHPMRHANGSALAGISQLSPLVLAYALSVPVLCMISIAPALSVSCLAYSKQV